MHTASETIYELKPVSFRYHKQYDQTQTIAFGLIAEEVAEVNPDLVGRNREGQPESVRYEQINAMLLNEFLKEHRKNEEQKADHCASSKKQIDVLTEGLQKVSAPACTASPSDGGLEASKFATGRIRRGGPAPQSGQQSLNRAPKKTQQHFISVSVSRALDTAEVSVAARV